MTDSLIDDVEALLNGEFGDDRILKQIHRACQNNEVISNFERNYVKNLAEKHLGRKPKIQPQAKPQQTTTPTPPIVNEIPPTPQKIQSIQTLLAQKTACRMPSNCTWLGTSSQTRMTRMGSGLPVLRVFRRLDTDCVVRPILYLSESPLRIR